jgi:hypothetical protein
MNSPNEDLRAVEAGRETLETLRVIANLPAPEGLEGRIQHELSSAPHSARILPWPSPRERWKQSAFARGAAAAAIVFVVGGGGWGVYSRVQPAQAPKVIAMPHIAGPGGFQSAGAMRTPQTLNRPVLTHPIVVPKENAAPSIQKGPGQTTKVHKREKSKAQSASTSLTRLPQPN